MIPISVVGIKSSGPIQVASVDDLQDLNGDPLPLTGGSGVTDSQAIYYAIALGAG